MNTEAIYIQNKEVVSIGVRLRNARQNFGLSQEVVAKRLCLKVSMIRNIEEDKMPTDLAPTFFRGYIRAYAKLVHIPENELLPLIENKELRYKKANIISSYKLSKSNKKHNNWLMSWAWLILSALIILTTDYWWCHTHKSQEEEIITINNQCSSELNNESRNNNKNRNLKIDRTLDTNKKKHSETKTSSQEFMQIYKPTNTIIMQQASLQNNIFVFYQKLVNIEIIQRYK